MNRLKESEKEGLCKVLECLDCVDDRVVEGEIYRLYMIWKTQYERKYDERFILQDYLKDRNI